MKNTQDLYKFEAVSRTLDKTKWFCFVIFSSLHASGRKATEVSYLAMHCQLATEDVHCQPNLLPQTILEIIQSRLQPVLQVELQHRTIANRKVTL